MPTFRVVRDLPECADLWRRHYPVHQISDLWEVRDCFRQSFGHPPYFIVAEEANRLVGLLPLVFNGDTESYQFFPGETWKGKTWLEQNRLIAADDHILQRLLRLVPGRFHVRYLLPWSGSSAGLMETDEIGYLFMPPRHDYNMDHYFHEFSHKSYKRLLRELAEFGDRRVEYRYDHGADFAALVALNVDRFGESSYFHDARFRSGFENLMSFLSRGGLMRMTTVLIDDRVAAVDLGAVYDGNYTLLAGGTCADFPGVAKLINVHHMRWACEQRLNSVDFLCGDFNWKIQFHLTTRPLYQITEETLGRRRPVATISSLIGRDLPRFEQGVGSAGNA